MRSDVENPGDPPPRGAAGLPPATTPAAGPPVGPGAPTGLAYQPALDGLRGLAVLAVFVFHGGATWAQGGYLGVSAFFTLSGFLITSLLLIEYRDRGHIDLRRFWSRRARRLLPAAWLTLAGIVVYGATAAEPATVRSLGGDVLSALAYVANWRFIATGDSYEAIFSAPSPAVHLWSLAIEEQYYVLFPLLLFGLLAVARGRLLVPALGLGILALASSAWMLGLHEPGMDTARVYYGTDTRAAEMLVGALGALIWYRVAATPGAASTRARRAAGAVVVAAGTVALAGMLVAWSSVAQTTDGLYRGGLLLHALATTAVIVSAMVPGPVRSALAIEPLRRLGLISYGVYLFHWPLFLYLDEARTGLDGAGLFTVRAVVTLAVAQASYVLVERPIRSGRVLHRRSVLVVAPLGVAVVAVCALLVSASAPTSSFAQGPAAPPPPVASSSDESGGTEGVDRPGVKLFGDSTALMLSFGVSDVDRLDGTVRYVPGLAQIGCGLVRAGHVEFHGRRNPVSDSCARWPEAWANSLEEDPADVAVVLVGPTNVADRQLEGDEAWRAPGDPLFDAALLAELRVATELLSREVSLVVWLAMPDVELGRTDVPPPARPYPESDPARTRRLNELIASHVDEVDSDRVVLIDLASWFARLPGGMLDPEVRPDGMHVTEESALLPARWLADQIMAVWQRLPPGAEAG